MTWSYDNILSVTGAYGVGAYTFDTGQGFLHYFAFFVGQGIQHHLTAGFLYYLGYGHRLFSQEVLPTLPVTADVNHNGRHLCVTVLEYRLNHKLKSAERLAGPAYKQAVPAPGADVGIVLTLLAPTPLDTGAKSAERDYLGEDFGKLFPEAISLILFFCH